MGRRSIPSTLTEGDRAVLEAWARGRSTPARLVERAKIVLASARGLTLREIVAEVGCGFETAHRWKKRFDTQGLEGIRKDAPRGGRPRSVPEETVREIVRRTTRTKPVGTHWSTRTLADELGVGRETVRRVWKEHGLKPHRTRTFKLSNDPNFAEKVEDIVGLYINPPQNALVFSVDEKSQMQALDRTQPGLPLKKGRCGTMTHDYKRNGTTTLFAALCVLTGHVIGECMKRHTHKEWLRFLKKIDAESPKHLDIHVICDNYATHKHPVVQRWLEKNSRFHVHFTPTSASWLNLVERFFRDLTDKAIRRGVFRSVPDLIWAVDAYIDAKNEEPKPFTWTASTQLILEKVARARRVSVIS
ncbi:IS630 family transposase [Myxococcota bacterium]|nr:IS630 family transposase [Myxococcota bacterium]